ncbi:UNVERIFIED_CONTAM: hypothetical protein FKN15_030774 [Acipenser sinensis]
MDVSISVSFFQDELASTIEHAVKAAVDAVLCEITKVVGGKFTEYQMEMTGKEKENESLKLRLEISEIELKAVRECMNSRRGSRHSKAGDFGERRAFSEAEEGPVIEAVYTKEEICGQEWCGRIMEITDLRIVESKEIPKLEPVHIKEEAVELECDHITEEIVYPAESHPALGTVIGFLSGVNPLVFFQHSGMAEPLPAVRALVGLLSSVDPPVDFQMLELTEALSTLVTDVADAGESTSSLLWPVASGGSRQLRIQSKTTTQEAQESTAGSFPDSRVRPLLLGSTETDGPETLRNTMSRSDPDLQIQTGKRPTPCPECGKSFIDSGNLKQHRRIHTGEKPYRCTECGKNFSELGNLKQHWRIHTGEKPYRCTECGKSFTHSNSLKIHERAHTGHTRYICDECGKSFSQFEHLKVHRRIHTGEKPYQCPDCGKRFRHSGVLKKHQRIHTGEKPYHCTECGMRFSRVDYLKAHQRLHS